MASPAKSRPPERSEELRVPIRKQLSGAAVVVEIQFAAAQGEDAPQDQLGDPFRMLLRVRQAQRAPPGTAEDQPPLDAPRLRAAAPGRRPDARWCCCSGRRRAHWRAAGCGRSRAGRTAPPGTGPGRRTAGRRRCFRRPDRRARTPPAYPPDCRTPPSRSADRRRRRAGRARTARSADTGVEPLKQASPQYWSSGTMCMAASSALAAAAVDPDVAADQVLVHIGADALIRIDQPPGAHVAHLAVVDVLQLVAHGQVVLRLRLGVRVRLGLLLGQSLVQRLPVAHRGSRPSSSPAVSSPRPARRPPRGR